MTRSPQVIPLRPPRAGAGFCEVVAGHDRTPCGGVGGSSAQGPTGFESQEDTVGEPVPGQERWGVGGGDWDVQEPTETMRTSENIPRNHPTGAAGVWD